jgi:hypothetical protein
MHHEKLYEKVGTFLKIGNFLVPKNAENENENWATKFTIVTPATVL